MDPTVETEESEEVRLKEVMLNLARTYASVSEEVEMLKKANLDADKAIEACKTIIKEKSDLTNKKIEELKDERNVLRNKLKDLKDEADSTSRELQEGTCIVRAYALLTNTKMVLIGNEVVGKMSNDATGKSKSFQYSQQDPKLSKKLWADLSELSTSD